MLSVRVPRVVKGAIALLLVLPVVGILFVPLIGWGFVLPARMPPPRAIEGVVVESGPLVSTPIGRPFVFGRVALECTTTPGANPRVIHEGLLGDARVRLRVPSGALEDVTLPPPGTWSDADVWKEAPPEDAIDVTKTDGIPGTEAAPLAECNGPVHVRLRAVRPDDALVFDAASGRTWFGTRATLTEAYGRSAKRMIGGVVLALAGVALLFFAIRAATRVA